MQESSDWYKKATSFIDFIDPRLKWLILYLWVYLLKSFSGEEDALFVNTFVLLLSDCLSLFLF